MALIRFAEGQQRSGSIGATVYSHNRSGAYIRARSVPVNPATDRQIAARNRMDYLVDAWKTTLTQAQRDAWEQYAAGTPWLNKLGDSIYLTGLNMYVRTNTLVLQAGGTDIDTAPGVLGVAAAEQDLAVVASEAAHTLSVSYDDTADWCDLAGAYQLVYMGAPVNPGIKFFGGPYRFAKAIAGDDIAPPSSPEVIPTGDVPWTFVEGQRIWVRTRIVLDDGRVSPFAQANFLAVA